MEGRSERKWKTLRHIGSPQEESEIAVVDTNRDEIEGVGAEVAPESCEEEEAEFEETGIEAGVVDGIIALPPEEYSPERVLVVLPVASTTRLIRETLENFTGAEVVTTSNPLRGFELALQRPYRVFLFGMQFEELSGPMLYELVSKAYGNEHGPKRLAPGVVFIREENDPKLPEELTRDVRVKDVISKPVRIDRLLKAVSNVIEVLDPTAG
jgi:CheY-like chemotaxis protein